MTSDRPRNHSAMTESVPSGCFQFGDFQLDTHRRCLTGLSGGDPIALPPRVLDTLAYLVEHPGELIDKATLLRAIWPRAVAEDNSLNQNISMLRRTLGERPSEHQYIVTVPGHGYRFVAHVRRLDAVVHSTAPAASVAVLPFANLSGNPANDHLGQGVAEEIIHQLARLPGLKVAARSSSFAFASQPQDVRRIAARLGVRAVLEGSVRSVDGRLRVAVQLIEGDTGYSLCSHSVEREPARLFDLEDELVRAIADALGIRSGVTRHSTADVEAHYQFMQARALGALPSENNLRGALECLKRATARDPNFARAWSLMAAIHGSCIEYDYVIPEAIHLAEQAARRSVALDPSDGAGLAAVGIIQALRGQWVDAESSFRAATSLRMDPLINNLRCIYVTQAVGHLDRALKEAREAYQYAVAQQFGATMVAMTQVLRGDDEEASQWLEVSAELGESVAMTPQADLRAQLAHRAGRHAEAAPLLIRSTPEIVCQAGGTEAIEMLCAALSGTTPRHEAIAALMELERRVPPAQFDQTRRKRLLVWYTMLGDLDAAFGVMNRAADHHATQGFVGSVWGWLWLPELRPFRRDPRFQGFVKRLGLLGYWERYGPPDGHELRGGLLLCP